MAVLEAICNDEAEGLRQSLAKHALRIAPPGQPFTLTSGKQSNLYLDTKHVTLSPEAVLDVGKLFSRQVRAYEGTAVGGLAAGAIPIAVAVIAHEALQGRTDIRAFYVRDDGAKTHGTRESLYQSFDDRHQNGVLSPESRVVVVDDVLTTGKSISIAMDELLARGAHVAAIVVLVDRGEGGAQILRERFGLPVVAIFTMDAHGNLTYCGAEVH